MLEDGDNALTPLFRELISQLYEEMVHLDQRIRAIENKLTAISVQHEDCLRIPDQSCHLIQAKAATHSTAKLPPIPVKVATL
jgi:hypothetical protein